MTPDLPTGNKSKVLAVPHQLPLHQVVTDEVCPDDEYNDDSMSARMMANRRACDNSKTGKTDQLNR